MSGVFRGATGVATRAESGGGGWGRAAEPVGEVLRRWMSRSGVLRGTDRDRIEEAWRGLLGPDAAHTRLEGLRGNVATFVVDSSALLAELRQFRKQELIEGLREQVKTYFVRDVRLRLEKKGPPQRPGGRQEA